MYSFSCKMVINWQIMKRKDININHLNASISITWRSLYWISSALGFSHEERSHIQHLIKLQLSNLEIANKSKTFIMNSNLTKPAFGNGLLEINYELFLRVVVILLCHEMTLACVKSLSRMWQNTTGTYVILIYIFSLICNDLPFSTEEFLICCKK